MNWKNHPRVKAFAYSQRSVAYLKKGNSSQAMTDFTKALELRSKDLPVCIFPDATYSKDDLDQEIANSTKELELSPHDEFTYHYRGAMYYKKGDFDLAIADFTKALELSPNYAWAYYYRGLTYDKKGTLDLAIADFTKALELSPNYMEAYHYRGLTYDKKGNLDLAIADLTKALELDPNYASAYFYRGFVYIRKGDPNLAIADFTKALELNPDYVQAYNCRGLMYYRKGDPDLAIADFNKALELNPDYAETYLFRSLVCSDKEDYAQAIADLNKTLELKPLDTARAGAHFHRGTIYLLKGKFLEAFDDFVDSNKYNPDLKFIYPQNYVASQIADIYEGSKKEDKAKAFELYLKLLHSIIKIQGKQFYKAEEGREVAHYTSLHTLKDLANKEQHFRFYNAAYMNDPEEGSVFFDIIKRYKPDVKKVFYEEDEDPPYPSPAYIGSFVMVGSENQESKDKLLLWRTYGKHDGQEAAGACLIFKHEGTCFEKTYEPQVGDMQRLQSKLPMVAGGLKNLGGRQHSKPTLYKIFYMDNENNKKLSKELNGLAESLNQVEHHISKGEDNRKNRLKRLARELLDNIRFLFKASHYKEEQEVRVIQLCYYDENMSQEPDGISIDTEQIPLRFLPRCPRQLSL